MLARTSQIGFSLQIKQQLSKVIRRLSYSVATLVIILAVFLSLARALAPLLSNYQPQLQSLVARLMHQPVTFGEVKVTWYWLEPVLEFSDVNVLSQDGQHSILKIQQLDIGLDIVDSMLARRFETGVVIASGSRLTVHQDSKGEVTIEGVEDLSPGLNKPGAQNARYVLEWLFSQDKIVLRDIDLQWIGADGTIVPVQNFSLSLVNDGDEHQLRGHGKLAQTIPSRLTIISKFEGKAQDILHWHGQLYIKASDVLIAQWLANHSLSGFVAKTGQVSAQCWLNWQALQLTSLEAIFKIKNLNLALENTTESQFFQQLQGQLTYKRTNNDWQIQMNDFIVRTEGQTWPNNQWQITKTINDQQQTNVQLYVHYLQLQTLLPLLSKNIIIPQWLTTPLLNLKPQGELFETVVQHTLGLKEWAIKTQFKQLALSKWQHIPSLKGLSGQLELTANKGQLQLNSSDLVIDSEALFRNPLFLDSWKGDYEWQHNEDGWWLTAKNNEIKNSDISLNTEFTWQSSPQVGKGELSLLGGFAFNNTQHIGKYLPAKLPSEYFDSDLVTWLDQAFDGVGSGVGTVIFRGNIDEFPFKNNQGIFLIESNINNINLHYWKDWPWAKQLFGELDFRNHVMDATIFSGKLGDMPIKNLAAEISDLGSKSKVLSLRGDITAKTENVLQFVSDSPVKDSVRSLNQVELKGPVYLALELLLPLKHLKRDFSLTIDALLRDGSLVLPYWHSVVDGLNGSLQISRNGVTGENLDANLFSMPAKIFIKPLMAHNNTVATEVTVQSAFPQISIMNMKHKVRVPAVCGRAENNFFLSSVTRQLICDTNTLLKGINGSSHYQATISIPSNTKEPLTFSLTSDLTGISSGLPTPFDKIFNQPLPLMVKASLRNNNILQIAAQLEKRASAIFQFELNHKQWQLRQGNLLLGDGNALLPTQKKLLVSGKLDQFDGNTWWPYLKQIATIPSTLLSASPYWFDLNLNNVALYGITFPTLSVQAKSDNGGWSLHFSGPVIEGDVILPMRENNNIKANLDRLTIRSQSNALDRILLKPADWPSMKIKVNQFKYNDVQLGTLLLNTTQQKNALTIDEFSLTSTISKLQTNGQWVESKGQDSTYLQGNFTSKSLAETLNMLGYMPFVSAKSVDAKFNFNWQGSPDDFALKRLDGAAALKIKEGNITHLNFDTELKIGMGRLINILSLQSLPRRLMLDFSDLTKEGFHFNKIQSQWMLKRGNAKLSSTTIEGSVANIEMTGDINLEKRQYNLLLNVTPQVTASLPVIIAAAAASPLAGAVTFVVSKIVSQIMEKTLFYTYKVTGPWNNPVVKEIEDGKKQ